MVASEAEWGVVQGFPLNMAWSTALYCECVGCVGKDGKSKGPSGRSQRGMAIAPPHMLFIAMYLVRALLHHRAPMTKTKGEEAGGAHRHRRWYLSCEPGERRNRRCGKGSDRGGRGGRGEGH